MFSCSVARMMAESEEEEGVQREVEVEAPKVLDKVADLKGVYHMSSST